MYAAPTLTDSQRRAAMIVGARLAGAITWIVNEGSDAVAVPSVTVIVMRADVPTFAAVGVPDRRPVVALNDAQLGWFWIE